MPKKSRKDRWHTCVTPTTLAGSVTLFQIGIVVGAIAVLTKRRSFWFGSLASASWASCNSRSASSQVDGKRQRPKSINSSHPLSRFRRLFCGDGFVWWGGRSPAAEPPPLSKHLGMY